MFASIFLGILELETGTLVYINGGHQAPLLIDNKGIKAQLDSTGTLVGALPNVAFEINHIQMDVEDSLFAYTDGLTEAKNQSGDFYGDKRLLKLVAQPFRSAGELVNGILMDINQHIYGTEQYDDITMLAIRRMKQLK
jgi:serine phosphatase RsbU (regulator of sigma subunit)